MLGWYKLTATTSLAEMEWMLARAAGYGAGFAMSTTLAELKANRDTGILLDAIREWETARRAGAFSEAHRQQLKDSAREFHLEAAGNGAWALSPVHASPRFSHARAERQPGEPTSVEWAVTNPNDAQPLQFRLEVTGTAGSVSRVTFDVDRAAALVFPVELQAGEALVVDGTRTARIYDAKGRQRGTVEAAGTIPRLSPGAHRIAFDCAFAGDAPPGVAVTFRTRGTGEIVRAR
jgi:hypothetical protein